MPEYTVRRYAGEWHLAQRRCRSGLAVGCGRAGEAAGVLYAAVSSLVGGTELHSPAMGTFVPLDGGRSWQPLTGTSSLAVILGGPTRLLTGRSRSRVFCCHPANEELAKALEMHRITLPEPNQAVL